MIKTTTQKDLLRYASNETGLLDSDHIQRSIDGDPLVQQEYNELLDAINSLDLVMLNPSQKSIEAILAFGKRSKA
jgi:hypothetical protein